MVNFMPDTTKATNTPPEAPKPIFDKAAKFLRDWAKGTTRPTRNGHQVKLYIDRANIEDMVAAVAFVKNRKGFPHSNDFHLLMGRVEKSEIEEARLWLESTIWAQENRDTTND